MKKDKAVKPPAGKNRLDLHYKDFADRIISQIKDGTAPWQKPWQFGREVLPQSIATGHEYKGSNSLHLMAVAQTKGYSDNRWATFKQIKAAGGVVREGEKSTKIVWWDFSRTQEKVAAKDREGNPILDDKGEPVLHNQAPRYRVYSVFNVEQAANMKLKPLVSDKPSWKVHQDADALIKASGVKINHVAGDRAFYSAHVDAVTLPKPGQFPDATSYYHTANHELGHATGHESRMNRETLNEGVKQGFGSEAYAREELRAEIAAMMTNTRLGLGHHSMEGAAYVASWVKVINDDPKEIHFAARDAQKISDHLITPIRDRLQNKEQQPAQEQQSEPHYRVVQDNTQTNWRVENANNPSDKLPAYAQGDFGNVFDAKQALKRLHQDQARPAYIEAAKQRATARPSLSDQMKTYQQTIPSDHVVLEAKPTTNLPGGPIAYKFEGHPMPQDLKGLTTKDFGYNQVIAHAPQAEVHNHFHSLPEADRPTFDTGPSR